MPEALTLTCLECGQRNRVPESRLTENPRCGTCGRALLDGAVASIGPDIHDKAIRDDLPLVVDYWAPWCGPCRAMAPNFAEAAQRLKGHARLAKLNTEDHPAIGQRLRITGIPLLIEWRAGREKARLPGLRRTPEIVDFVRANGA